MWGIHKNENSRTIICIYSASAVRHYPAAYLFLWIFCNAFGIKAYQVYTFSPSKTNKTVAEIAMRTGTNTITVVYYYKIQVSVHSTHG